MSKFKGPLTQVPVFPSGDWEEALRVRNSLIRQGIWLRLHEVDFRKTYPIQSRKLPNPFS